MKKISLLSIAFFAFFVLSACSSGSPAPQEPPQNRVNNVIPSSVTVVPDTKKPCTTENAPVCGKVQVQCFKAPCPPISTDFLNRCEAENAKATDIVAGGCKEGTVTGEAQSPEKGCISNNGTWLFQSKECEGISKEICEKLGGAFNECASACRNDPKAEVCTMQCVLVCQF